MDILEEFHLDGYENEKQKVKFNILSSIIDDYISLKDFDNAKIYALKSSDDINLSGESKSENPGAWDEVSEIESWRSQQTELIERIEKAEKLLKKQFKSAAKISTEYQLIRCNSKYQLAMVGNDPNCGHNGQ